MFHGHFTRKKNHLINKLMNNCWECNVAVLKQLKNKFYKATSNYC